ncbi:MAG: MFS transporter [Chitinophagales bacterium]|nr:MFS transporter [Bacteroidota bacterium]MCB9043471.1 MFS transporter [Chitinophagales bacterium]
MLAIQKKMTNSFLTLLSLPATAMGFALSVQISALSWILSTKFGLAIHEVGLVWAAGPIAGILGQVIVGIISDKVWFWNGRRRPFILIGGILAALMLLALPNIDKIADYLNTGSILGVAITVALMLDLSINVSFNPTRSIIADVTSEKDRTKGYTWMQTISGTFGVLAYAIGAIKGNYFLIYFGAALVLLFSVIPPFFIEEPRTLHEEETNAPQSNFSVKDIFNAIKPLWGFLLYGVYGLVAKLLNYTAPYHWAEIVCLMVEIYALLATFMQTEVLRTDGKTNLYGFQKVLGAHAFTWVGIQTMFVYMFAYVRHQLPEFAVIDDAALTPALNDKIGSILSWAFLILNLVAAILPALVLEPLTRRIGRVKTHYLCLAVMAIAYGGILFLGNSPAAIYFFMALAGIGWAATVSLPFAIMSNKVDQRQMGLFMGLFNLSVVLPQLLASLFIGQIIQNTPNKAIIFMICALCLGFSALLWTLVKERKFVIDAPVKGGGGH